MKLPIPGFGLDLHHRQLRPEWMDQPELDVNLHRAALGGLERINAISAIHWSFLPAIRRIAREHPTREIRVLDVACGGGDVAIRLANAARRAKLRVTIDGCDRSATALSLARERAERSQSCGRFFEFDVLRDQWPTDYDVIGTALFLHHLTTGDAIAVLGQMAAATKRLLIVNDLVRCRIGDVLARVVARMLTRSPIVHADGPDSVAGAFTIAELREMARCAGLHGATVASSWPARMLLEWNKP